MTSLHLFLLLISAVMFGMVFAVIVIPAIIEFIKRKTLPSSDWAEHLTAKKDKYKVKQVRRSDVFKKRLQAILDSIEEKSKEKRNRIVVTSMGNCNTDKEIRKVLRERGFDTDFEYEGDNSLTIRWKNKS